MATTKILSRHGLTALHTHNLTYQEPSILRLPHRSMTCAHPKCFVERRIKTSLMLMASLMGQAAQRGTINIQFASS